MFSLNATYPCTVFSYVFIATFFNFFAKLKKKYASQKVNVALIFY